MYKFDNGQISLEDFGQPIGMNLKDSNRWVKRAQLIPWIEIEKKYAKLFSNKKGNVAKSLRLGLGARIIQSLRRGDPSPDSRESIPAVLLRLQGLRRQQAAVRSLGKRGILFLEFSNKFNQDLMIDKKK